MFETSTEIGSIKGRHFFLTVPHFEGTIDDVFKALCKNQPEWEYLWYCAVIETHTKDVEKGNHLHLYVGFPKQCRIKFTRFDYLGKHGKLERVRDYSSVLKYMTKENLPRANFNYIKEIMRKDFPRAVQILLSQGLHIREIYHQYSSIVASKNWSGYLRYLSYQSESGKLRAQIEKPGIRMITPKLIKARLSAQEYKLFYDNDVYQRIVDKLNDIVIFGCNRPFKAHALLLVGEPNLGKTTLGLALQSKIATFTFPDDGWWQGYESDIFKIIFWDQMDLRKFAYPTLLKFLQGLRMDLPIKGSHTTRTDNPLIYMTSNLTLEQHVSSRFSSQENRGRARANLRVRIDEINIKNAPVFFLEKLLVSPLQDI